MTFDAHADLAVSTVATAPSPATSGTSLVVQAGQGTWFPATPFYATAWPSGANPTLANAEIVRVTNISTNTFTIVRAQGPTSAQSIAVGWVISNTVTAEDLRKVEAAAAAAVPVVQGSTGTNLGATATLNFNSVESEIWLVGTLNTNLTVTTSNRAAGCSALLLLTQDAVTGHWTLTVTDGSSPQSVPITSTAGALSVVEINVPDSSTTDIVVPGASALVPSAQVFTAAAAFTPFPLVRPI